ncbi:GAF and ANTAR domain-containing protein [Modestobacter sp. VKM Ac-2986]|uniref:GAF and ANTAR domain-containing protein n=1 Tax=Modestobacter sp. VKM Ac-2986 TaxID=3004140 RepID=UPI0022AA4BD3|nr:GAF and ANTAR domain-containing protein [Modestobacter sp. VKM Ac-2986]MCZ2827544.1 GAF and ANTAR domain-containing protein [Modestobacter sp. VKM Ac-2986]
MTSGAQETGSAQTGESLGDVLSRVARELQHEHGDVEGTLQGITRAAVDTVPGADECGISYVVRRRDVQPRAWTSDLPRELDALQGTLGEGPCLDAIWDHRVVSVPDVAGEGRWPQFTRGAAARGVGSLLCFQLFVEGDALGALNLYARRAGAFDAESEDVGQLFAAHAAVALAGAEHESNLRAGMDHRDLIGQAKGILMERHRLTAVQAFDLLVRTSSLTNRKLRDVADELTSTGHLATTGGE